MTLLLPYPEPPLATAPLYCERGDTMTWSASEAQPRIPGFQQAPPSLRSTRRRRARPSSTDNWVVKGQGLSLVSADAATDIALGLIALLFREDRAVLGLGYWIVPEARGNGLARHAVTLLAPWSVRQPGIQEVEALVEPHNATSIRVLEGAAFVRDGVLTRYLGGERDAYRYVLRRPGL